MSNSSSFLPFRLCLLLGMGCTLSLGGCHAAALGCGAKGCLIAKGAAVKGAAAKGAAVKGAAVKGGTAHAAGGAATQQGSLVLLGNVLREGVHIYIKVDRAVKTYQVVKSAVLNLQEKNLKMEVDTASGPDSLLVDLSGESEANLKSMQSSGTVILRGDDGGELTVPLSPEQIPNLWHFDP